MKSFPVIKACVLVVNSAPDATTGEATSENDGQGGVGFSSHLDVEWDYGATATLDRDDVFGSAPDACLHCGARVEDQRRTADSDLLHCMMCAELFHSFCTPFPRAEVQTSPLSSLLTFSVVSCSCVEQIA